MSEQQQPHGRFEDDLAGLLETARALVDPAQQWAKRTFGELNSEHRPEDCRWCPICQFVALVRGEAPELAEKLAEAAATFTAAVKALLETAQDRSTSRPRPRPSPTPAPDAPPASPPPAAPSAAPQELPKVHKINLGDVSE